MGTSIKTVHFRTHSRKDIPLNNTNTLLVVGTEAVPEQDVKICLPENSKVFKSVIVIFNFRDKITATGGSLTTKNIGISLSTTRTFTAFTNISNANVLTNSGENIHFELSGDFTQHFINNWAGTEMFFQASLQINQSTGTTLGMTDCFAEVIITYEYDDQSPIQAKTVFLPLNAPTGTPETNMVVYDTIPNLTTYLPEVNKVFYNTSISVIGNSHGGTGAIDVNLDFAIGSFAGGSPRTFVRTLASNIFFHLRLNIFSNYFDFNNTNQFGISCDQASYFYHLQVFMVITYTYEIAETTTILNSLMLPMEVDSPMGGTSEIGLNKSIRDLIIQEPDPIVTDRIAFYPYWVELAAIAGLNFRIGNGSFISYGDATSVMCGSNAAMVRNDSAFTLQRGRNILNFDCYRTDTLDFGWNVSGFWIINYRSGVSAAGVAKHNKTIFKGIATHGTGAIENNRTISNTNLDLPEPDYYLNSVGFKLTFMSSGLTAPSSYTIQIERKINENGLIWENGYRDLAQTDPEVGVFTTYSQARNVYKTFSGDNITNKIDPKESRRIRYFATNSSVTTGAGWPTLFLMYTFHSIKTTISGTITGFNGMVTIELWNSDNKKLLTTTRNGDGIYSFDVFNDSEEVFVLARDSTKQGRTTKKLINTADNFDINLNIAQQQNSATYYSY